MPTPAPPLIPPTLSQTHASFEYSAHALPRRLARDIRAIFPSLPPNPKNLILVPTMQQAQLALLEFGDAQAAEKDRLLERFMDWATAVREAVHRIKPNAWVDITDPVTGVAHFGVGGGVYPDVEGIRLALKYQTIDVGGCRVVKHPDWGFAVYPATLFTNADVDILREALRVVNQDAAGNKCNKP